jgi:hypothetical protein
MEREELSCTGWTDVSVSALRHDLPRDVLLLNLQVHLQSHLISAPEGFQIKLKWCSSIVEAQ